MREIEYRGKREDNGGWVYGGIMVYGNGDGKRLYIIIPSISPTFIEVIPETVGQYTGLKDKNGVKIFEGDIVKAKIERAVFCTEVRWGKQGRGWRLKCDRKKIERFGTVKYYALPDSEKIEVIGNIHDNPELLNGKGGAE
jgi:hypothetical protein